MQFKLPKPEALTYEALSAALSESHGAYATLAPSVTAAHYFPAHAVKSGIAVALKGNVIAVLYRDGSIALGACGWHTVSTRNALNAILAAHESCAGWRVKLAKLENSATGKTRNKLYLEWRRNARNWSQFRLNDRPEETTITADGDILGYYGKLMPYAYESRA